MTNAEYIDAALLHPIEHASERTGDLVNGAGERDQDGWDEQHHQRVREKDIVRRTVHEGHDERDGVVARQWQRQVSELAAIDAPHHLVKQHQSAESTR